MIDLFKIKPSLRYSNGEDGVNSRPGQVASIIVILGTLAITSYLLTNVFQRTDFKISVSDTIVEDPPVTTMDDETFPIGFALEDPTNFEPFIDEKIYYPKMLQIIKTKVVDSYGVEKFTFQNYTIDLERCTLDHFPRAREKFEKAFLNNRYCVAKNQTTAIPKLEGVWESDVNVYLIIQMFKCVNDSTSPVVCSSSDEIKNMLDGGYIDMTYVDIATDLSNFEKPAYMFKNSYFTNTGSSFFRYINMYLKKMSILSDDGFLAESLNKHDYILLDSAQELFEPTNSGTKIIEIQIQMSRSIRTQKRIYVKILDTISKINGGFAALFLLIGMILKPYLNFKYYEQLINKTFDIKFRVPMKHLTKIIKKQSKNSSSRKLDERKFHSFSILRKTNIFFKKFLSKQGAIVENAHTEENNMLDIRETKINSESTPISSQKREVEIPHFESEMNKGQLIEIKQIPAHQPDNSVELSFKDSDVFKDEKDNEKDIKKSSPERNELENQKTIRSGVENEYETQEDNQYLNASKVSPRYDSKVQGEICINSELIENTNHTVRESPEKKLKKKRNGIIFDPNEAEFIDATAIIDGATIDLGFCEYYMSFFCRSEKTRQKISILREGIEIINKIIDINYLMKNAKEVDQLKTLFLTPEQEAVMSKLPKPIIPQPKDHELKRMFENQVEMFRYFIPDKDERFKNDHVVEDLKRSKQRLSTIDQKLISAFGKKKDSYMNES